MIRGSHSSRDGCRRGPVTTSESIFSAESTANPPDRASEPLRREHERHARSLAALRADLARMAPSQHRDAIVVCVADQLRLAAAMRPHRVTVATLRSMTGELEVLRDAITMFAEA